MHGTPKKIGVSKMRHLSHFLQKLTLETVLKLFLLQIFYFRFSAFSLVVFITLSALVLASFSIFCAAFSPSSRIFLALTSAAFFSKRFDPARSITFCALLSASLLV